MAGKGAKVTVSQGRSRAHFRTLSPLSRPATPPGPLFPLTFTGTLPDNSFFRPFRSVAGHFRRKRALGFRPALSFREVTFSSLAGHNTHDEALKERRQPF